MTLLTLPMPFSDTLYTEGTRVSIGEELVFDEPSSMLSRVSNDLKKQVLEQLQKSKEIQQEQSELQKEIANAVKPVNFNIKPPDGPPHPKYRDGREVWKGADGSTWRYNQRSLNWIQTSEGSPK